MVQVSADHIAAGGSAGSYEPQRSNNFTVELEGLEEWRFVLQRTNFPKYTHEPIDIHFMNGIRKFAGKTTYDDIQVTVFDVVDREVFQQLYNWSVQVFDPVTECIGRAANYKREGSIILVDGCGQATRSWKLIGVWPTNVDPGEGSSRRRTGG